jgi:para-nitrobenzyl esterase
MHTRVALPGILLLLLSVVGCQKGPPATEAGADRLAIATVPATSTARLSISSPAIREGGDIAAENTAYRESTFPGLSWSAGPSGTQSYAIIVQDGDALRNDNLPVLHWSIVNIPSTVTRLDSAMTAPPSGASYGPNVHGANQPYWGPRTPAGPKHRYHFQVFALDTVVAPEGTANYSSLIAALRGHVLASGQLVGLGHAIPGA